MTDEFFRTDRLAVGYGKKPLIKDICLSLGKGEIMTLIGPNGAGKTTILRTIIRELSLLGGCVFIGNDNIGEMSMSALASKMSVMLTSNEKSELMTVRDVVSMGRYPYTGRLGILSTEDKQKVHEAMALTDVSSISEKDYSQISDGQRQRVLLARALCQEPEVLVLDEPTSYLDIRYKLSFLSLLQRLAREKYIAVILSLHELDLAQKLSDRIACVNGDSIVRYGTPEEIFSDGFIRELYGIEAGAYSSHSGSAELCRPQGKPSVFVIGGGGYGAETYRKLQRSGRAFYTGILWENDIDFPSAKALSDKCISVPPFSEISEDKLSEAKALIDKCDEIICSVPTELLRGFSEPLKELIRYAENTRKAVKSWSLSTI